jgi:hypothetical protein
VNYRIYSEKRDYIRMQMEAAVALHLDDQVTPARCLDLSSTGMQVEATSCLVMGQQFYIMGLIGVYVYTIRGMLWTNEFGLVGRYRH